MARIRSVKPEFWTDERVLECSLIARLLFIGTWNFADDEGNLDRSTKQIKMKIFPADDIDCESLIQELITHSLLIEYEFEGKKYLHINSFKRHQHPKNPAKPACPQPQSYRRTTPVLPEDYPSPTGGLPEDYPTEGLGLEGLGEERLGEDWSSSPPIPPRGEETDSANTEESQHPYPPKLSFQSPELNYQADLHFEALKEAGVFNPADVKRKAEIVLDLGDAFRQIQKAGVSAKEISDYLACARQDDYWRDKTIDGKSISRNWKRIRARFVEEVGRIRGDTKRQTDYAANLWKTRVSILAGMGDDRARETYLEAEEIPQGMRPGLLQQAQKLYEINQKKIEAEEVENRRQTEIFRQEIHTRLGPIGKDNESPKINEEERRKLLREQAGKLMRTAPTMKEENKS